MTNSGVPVVPLFITETGEYSAKKGTSWVDANGQARCLSMTMVRGAAANLTGVIWWTFKDFPNGAPYPQNTWKYGIVTEYLKKKPSYNALKTLVTELNGMDYSATMSNMTGFKGVEAYSFVSGTVKKYVVWGYSKPKPPETWVTPECGWPRYSNKATFKAKKLRVVNYLGKVTTIIDNSTLDKDLTAGKIAILAGADPQIVQINPKK
jgi:hypothetical protein